MMRRRCEMPNASRQRDGDGAPDSRRDLAFLDHRQGLLRFWQPAAADQNVGEFAERVGVVPQERLLQLAVEPRDMRPHLSMSLIASFRNRIPAEDDRSVLARNRYPSTNRRGRY